MYKAGYRTYSAPYTINLLDGEEGKGMVYISRTFQNDCFRSCHLNLTMSKVVWRRRGKSSIYPMSMKKNN